MAIEEPANKEILAIRISMERNMFVVVECFLSGFLEEHGEHPLSTDGGTWYPQACGFLRVEHHVHSPHEKSIIERMVQYIKDRTDNLMTVFHAKRRDAN